MGKGQGKKYQVLGKFTIETRRGMVHAGGYVYESDFPAGVIEQLLQRKPPKITSVSEDEKPEVVLPEPKPEPEEKPKAQTLSADYLKDNYTKAQLQELATEKYNLELADSLKKSEMIDAIRACVEITEEKPSYSFGR